MPGADKGASGCRNICSSGLHDVNDGMTGRNEPLKCKNPAPYRGREVRRGGEGVIRTLDGLLRPIPAYQAGVEVAGVPD